MTSELAPVGAAAETGNALPDDSVLDNPVWTSLTGPHLHLAEGFGHARRYPPDIASFVGLSDSDSPQVWDDLKAVAGPGAVVPLTGVRAPVPDGWQVEAFGEGVQMVATSRFVDAPDPDAVVLGAVDVPDMLDLIERTKPGPFQPRTYLLGSYLGIRRDGRLIAMAGERLHPPGWTEISAVCTDAAYRGEGLATRLVRAVAANIRARGETPFLHASASNINAIRLYSSLGFELRRQVTFLIVHVPQ